MPLHPNSDPITRPPPTVPDRLVTGNDVLRAAMAVCGVGYEQVVGKGRHPDTVTCRQITAYLCRELTRMSYPEIATLLGSTGHTATIGQHRRAIQAVASGELMRRESHAQAGTTKAAVLDRARKMIIAGM